LGSGTPAGTGYSTMHLLYPQVLIKNNIMRKVVLVDDHVLLRNSLARAVGLFSEYSVLFQANNGKHFTEMLDPANLPNIVILDVTMPVMNGYALWITTNYPQIKVIALSMLNDERTIIKMLRNGAKGYLLKDTELDDLKKALDDVSTKGIYINDILYKNIVQTISGTQPSEEYEKQLVLDLTEREKEFLRWLCTDKSYKEIAAAMYLSPRTVDGYRDILFEKVRAASRIGLVLFAIRNNITTV
jgi:two-component system invasion response regulator UvrY